jgi:Bacterial protein of unknown function (DUF899)
MAEHKVGTREEWLAARIALLEREKELTRRSDKLARERQELPWVRVEKEYRFETDEGTKTLPKLFDGRSQVLVYHFMFGPAYTRGLPDLLRRGRYLRRRRRPLEPARRHVPLRLARAAREARGLQAADGLELPLGLDGGKRVQLRFRRLVHGGATTRRGRVQLPLA